jgi:hypothetical protein
LATGKVSLDDPVICILTGAGIRWPDQLAGMAVSPVQVDPDPAAVD